MFHFEVINYKTMPNYYYLLGYYLLLLHDLS